jgi:hypothetical protein
VFGPPAGVDDVPLGAVAAATSGRRAAASADAGTAAPALGATDLPGDGADGARPLLGRAVLPWYVRLAVWVVALPFGLAVVFGGARAFHLLTSSQLLDTFTGTGWDRFVPVARLLPIAALITAVLVQLAITYLERRQASARTSPRRSGRGTPPGAPRPDAPPRGRARSRSRVPTA